ncbi:MAG: FAD-dependent oxidoreductase [Rhodospirillaceae bacterium]|nr:FAD-dependent oxidoreductase [Rhodospirillaceae bacterium]MBT4670467.1 FAD-dependent oxidoreductase [Rhodospirillaceae bacterium]MBT4719509.1 FAD-dependent oxidoreductase [Rhodospirillaceae bacterium]MBT4751246.1 FAD-dependent oxidoreductase [Rhodospirillaceae bacterium]MBT5177840.1 FAD-dependent oxidoreductase [Rhodospirillaceae bacterium]
MAKEFDILVAGGGIAGLTAGLTAARLGRSVQVLTGDVLGGNLLSIEKIEGFPGFADGVAGYELCPITQGQAAEAGAGFAMTEVIELQADGARWNVTDPVETYSAGAVIIATGASIKELGVPGEEALRGHGVSHCASCDAPLLKDKVVAVVGGGDSAAQEALTLAGAASSVTIYCREDALIAKAVYQARIEAHAGIDVRYGTTIDKILGDDVVTGISAGGADMECDGVFIYIGLAPNTGFLNGLLDLGADGRVPVDEDLRSQVPGLFAAGCVRTGSAGQAASSAGDGAAAAIAADAYLEGGTWR